MIADIIEKIGNCLPVWFCLFFKNFLKKNENIIAKIKLQVTTEKPSLKIGAGEYNPRFDK